MNLYYMRDNHTFRKLSLNFHEAVQSIKEEYDAGYTHGSFCCKDPNIILHCHGNLAEFLDRISGFYKNEGLTMANSELNPLDIKYIKIITCKQCPYSKHIHNNKHIACNHTKIQVKFPYEREREVVTDTIPGYCPL